jgi:hypothetical protein
MESTSKSDHESDTSKTGSFSAIIYKEGLNYKWKKASSNKKKTDNRGW